MKKTKHVTVADLIELLEVMPQKHVVILSSDPEGNSFSPIDSLFGLGHFEYGEFYNSESDDEDDDYCKPSKKAKPCVALWPGY